MHSAETVASEAFKLPLTQLPRVLFHAIIIGTIIASFWILDSIKDPIFTVLIGIEYQPMAKVLSVGATFLFVCAYDALTSLVSKTTLFYMISIYFGTLFFISAALLSHPSIGINNIHRDYSRVIGWTTFFAIECYGSLMVALFWSFTNTVMDVYLAKASYGLIVSAAQLGALLGSSVATKSSDIGIPTLLLISSVMILSVNILVKLYQVVYPQISSSDVITSQFDSYEGASTLDKIQSYLRSLYEGVILIRKYRYVTYLLEVTLLYEIMVTMIEYKFKVMGASETSTWAEGEESDGNSFVLLLARFGQFTNIISFCISFFAFTYLINTYGVKSCLMVFPALLMVGFLLVCIFPKLWLIFFVVSVLKALIFSFFDPMKEILYVPTSDSIKFKAASWIEVFGARFAKAIGSFLNRVMQHDVHAINLELFVLALFLGSSLLYLVYRLGYMFDDLVEEGKIIGNNRRGVLEAINKRFKHLPVLHGVRPGEVGYAGYDEDLFEGKVPLKKQSLQRSVTV